MDATFERKGVGLLAALLEPLHGGAAWGDLSREGTQQVVEAALQIEVGE